MGEVKATFSKKTIDRALKELVPENSFPINSIISDKGVSDALIKDPNPKANKLKEKSGIYIFWWDLSKSDFIKSHKRIVIEKVPKKSLSIKVTAEVTDDWIEAATFNNKVCLYVGKTTDLRGRMSGHLKLRSPKCDPYGKKNRLNKNTESQMRLALEALAGENMLQEIRDNVTVSYHIMRSYSESINRFYIEDALIGKYFPLFNIDIER